MRPLIAIVGRPNVGKSTLFNRLVGKRLALVEDVPGVTRDRNYSDGEWDGRPYTVVDTGGFFPEGEEALLDRVREQATLAIDEAAVVVVVVDGTAGRTATDEDLARMLRRSGKPVFLAVNKMDSFRRETEEYLAEFYSLGLKNVFPVSAEHGRGVSDLMDAVLAAVGAEKQLPEEEIEQPDLCHVAVVGRPNVGKSTFINKLLGEERLVVSEIPGTTRDSIDVQVDFEGRKFVLTDTAGLRRKKSISLKMEHLTVVRAFKSIDAADVVVLLLDAREPAVDQELKIAGLALEKGKPIIIAVNKWDLLEGDRQARERYAGFLKQRFAFVDFALVVYVSALTGEKVTKVLDVASDLFGQYLQRVPTPKLNQLLRYVVDAHPAPLAQGRPVKLLYIAQVGARPPTFVISTNRPQAISADYRRYLMNQIREAFGLRVPVRLLIRGKTKQGSEAGPERKIYGHRFHRGKGA